MIRCAKVIEWSHKLPALQKFRRPIFGSLQLSALAVGPRKLCDGAKQLVLRKVSSDCQIAHLPHETPSAAAERFLVRSLRCQAVFFGSFRWRCPWKWMDASVWGTVELGHRC